MVKTLDGHGILWPKEKGKRIMVSDSLLPWSRLNLPSLPHQYQEQLVKWGVPLEAINYFEYRKMVEGH